MPNKRNRQDEPFESAEYKKLVADIKEIINDAKAKGIDLTQRMDTLSCDACGAYEEITSRGHRIVVDPNEQITTLQQFVTIDSTQKSFHRNKVQYYKVTYNFICSACGTYQNEVVREKFPVS